MGLTRAQIELLLRPVPESVIISKQGQSYVPAHEVKAQLTRVFGPGGWDHTIHDVAVLYETKLEQGDNQYPKNGKGQPYYVTCYRVACTLRVRDYEGNLVATTTEYHAEENAPLPNRGEAHAMALTSAESYALRRAALDLGDAMGLHLYDSGRKGALIRGSLVIRKDPDAPLYRPDEATDAQRQVEGSLKGNQGDGAGA